MTINNANDLNRIIHHYISAAVSQKTDYKFCDLVVKRVLPLFKNHQLYNQWQKDKDEYFKERNVLENQALEDLKQCFRALQERLFNNGLLDQLDIKQQVCVIESMLEFKVEACANKEDVKCSNCGGFKEDHRIYVLPSYLNGIYQHIVQLCENLLLQGHEHLLKGYVQICYINSYVPNTNMFQRNRCMSCYYLYDSDSAPRNSMGNPIPFHTLVPGWLCPECGSSHAGFLPLDLGMVLQINPQIQRVMFADRYFELESMDAVFSSWINEPSNAPIWIAFEILSNMGWLFTTPRDFFRKKRLHYNNVAACTRSKQLLELHDSRYFITNIKQKKRRRERRFYNRDYYMNALATVQKALPVDETSLPLSPISIELIIEDDIRLRLKIEWLQGITEVCDLHAFQEGEKPENIIHEFIEKLVGNPGTDSFLNCNKPGSNATKFLRKVGICSLLEMIFIDEKTAYSARLKAMPIKLAGFSEIYLRKLLRTIGKLRTVTWGDIKN